MRADPMGRQDPHDERDANRRFEACYADVAPALYAWAELRIRPSMRARLEPQDLVQEVWLRGMKSYARFEERGISFRAWAFKIGKNILMETIRAARSDPGAQGTPSQAWLSLDGIPQNITSFTQRLAREDSVRAFLAHAAELDEDDRMLLIHCGLEDETCAEASVKLGLTEDAAIKRWQRLKTRLRERPWARTFVDIEPDARSAG
jgi:RNA polymerase sigma factor (sigma-70 family)